jgi:hypothetical protein
LLLRWEFLVAFLSVRIRQGDLERPDLVGPQIESHVDLAVMRGLPDRIR